jgi:hypothetical protein
MKMLEMIRLTPICLVFAVVASPLQGQTIRLPTAGGLTKTKPPETHELLNAPDALKAKEAQSKTAKAWALPCSIFPTRDKCRTTDYPDTDRVHFINAFYRTYNSISFFNQIKSIYNGASGSATVSADLTSLNFTNGMQVNVGTNVQAGSSGSPTGPSGSIPTLSGAAAGQATQNMLYGGTLVASALYPLLAIGAANVDKVGGFGLGVDMVGRQGIDIQNFKSGTNTSVTSPPSHSNAQLEGYLWYNSTNLAPNSATTFAGALFVGGSYGWSYTSHDYARDYGFGDRVNNAIGQISAGILINDVAKISVSRAFGPSQTYLDGTSMIQKTVNNFKSWSIGITYQAANKGEQ